MEKYLYITALFGLSIEKRINDPIEICENTYITNNPKHYEKHLSESHKNSIGSLELQVLQNELPVIYKIENVSSHDQSKDELINFLRDAHGFLTSLWCHEDNNVNIELGFALSQDSDNAHSNYLQLCCSSSNGDERNMEINKQDLSQIADFSFKYFKGFKECKVRNISTLKSRTVGRLSMSTSILQQARSTSDLALKIASYCTYFESILNTGNSELSFQMAYRASIFLRTKPEEQLSHFKLSKKAYAIRSKVVHGEMVSDAELRGLPKVSSHCDQVARELLKKIIMEADFNKLTMSRNRRALDDFFIDKIFRVVNVD